MLVELPFRDDQTATVMDIQFSHDLDVALHSVIEPGRAVPMRSYMRDQFNFLGIPTPQRRMVTRPLFTSIEYAEADVLLAYAVELWKREQREYQYAALDLLQMHWKKLGTSDIPSLITLAQEKAWWDTVDGMAGIVSDVLRHGHEGMDVAVEHRSFWIRRLAMLHQLGWRDRVDEDRLFSYALKLAGEKEFFIQKAIGWALRDYARYSPEQVIRFTQANIKRLAPLSYREANKHLKLE